MTSSAAPRPVDLDLLADYVAGALDDAALAEIAALVAGDGPWAQAHAALRAALGEVDAELHEYAAADPPAMPDVVAARISSALRAEAARGPGSASSIAPDAGSDALPASLRQRPAVAGGERRRASGPARHRLVLAAAGVAVVALGVGVGIAATRSQNSSNASSGLSTAAGPKAAAGAGEGSTTFGTEGSPALFPSLAGVSLTASGRAYTAATLRSPSPAPSGIGPTTVTPNATSTASPSSTVSTTDLGAAVAGTGPYGAISALVPAPLQRLLDAAPLNACVAAIGHASGGVVEEIDFASYQGMPSLVVTLADGSKFVAGADCGLPGHGADEIARG